MLSTSVKPYTFLPLQQLFRCLSISAVTQGKSRTLEPRPVPHHSEATEPLKWAQRLFELNEKKKSLKQNDSKEIAIKPSPPLVHMVCRVMPWRSLPFYEKAMLTRYGLGQNTKLYTWVLCKNTPSVNEDLFKIKNLIRIQPVTFPQGLPTDPENLVHCKLRPDGQFVLHSGIKATLKTEDDVKALTAGPETDDTKLSRKYLRSYHNKQWAKFSLFKDFYTSHYQYKLNQDGSEYRYSELWRLDNSMKQSIANRKNTDGTLRQSGNRFEADWNTHPWRRY